MGANSFLELLCCVTSEKDGRSGRLFVVDDLSDAYDGLPGWDQAGPGYDPRDLGPAEVGLAVSGTW